MARLSEAAAHIDLKERRFRQLIEAGVFKRPKRPSDWNLDKVRVEYIRHLREQAASRVGSNPKRDPVGANVAWREANTRLVDLRYQKESGEVFTRKQVTDMWQHIMLGTRSLVLRIPSDFHFREPALTPHSRQVLEQIVRDCLEDAAMGRGLVVLGPDARCDTCGSPLSMVTEQDRDEIQQTCASKQGKSTNEDN
jgi:hypothetical protein